MKMEEEALFVFPTDDSIQYLGMLLFFQHCISQNSNIKTSLTKKNS